MTTRILKGTTPVFFVNDHRGPDDLVDANKAIDSLSFTPWCRQPDGSLRTPAGWTYVGEADVTLMLVDNDTLVANKVESLRAQRTKEVADSYARTVAIDAQIQQLLAITNQAEIRQ